MTFGKGIREFFIGFCAGICMYGLIDIHTEKSTPVKMQQTKTIIAPKIKELPQSMFPCIVTKIVDGDTVDVSFNVWTDIKLTKRIRFSDLDTWEVRGENKEKGKEATLCLISLLEGRPVFLKTNRKTGKYGRTLGSLYVMKESGELMNVSEEMIKAGHQKVKVVSEPLP